MKASDYIARKLSQYTKTAFTGQGGSVVHILDSIKKNNKIKIIPSQNEQGASLAADAFSRVSKEIGLVIATSGPGIINCFQGIAASYYDSIPSLYISGAPVTNKLKKNRDLRQLGFQEMDVINTVKSFTKYAVRVTDPKKIKYEIEKCVSIAYEGRKGPCLIDLPDDLQRKTLDPKKLISYRSKIKKYNLNNLKLKKVINLIKNSEKPLVILGNGIKNNNKLFEINKFLKKTNLPYCPTWGAIDLFNSKDKMNIGNFGVYATRYGNHAVQNADLLIILGSRLSGTLIGGNPKLFSPKSKKIHVDIDKAELREENQVKNNLSFNCDLFFFLKRINKMIKKKLKKKDKWLKQIINWKTNNPVVLKKYFKQKKNINPYVFFETLSKTTNKKDIVIPDASANLVWAYQSYQFKKNHVVFTSLNHSPMGYSVAAAIGASIGKKGSRIIPTIGDGSMQMNIQEIQNIKHYNLPIKIFILNNKGYGMVKQTIDTWLGGRYVGCDLKSDLSLPDYLSVFKSYGIKSVRLKNQKNLKKNLKKILDFKGPIMCEVLVDPNQRIEPKVKFGSPLNDMLP